jgi:hypothetical protein
MQGAFCTPGPEAGPRAAEPQRKGRGGGGIPASRSDNSLARGGLSLFFLEEMMKKLPIGIQLFEKIIREGFVYQNSDCRPPTSDPRLQTSAPDPLCIHVIQ